MKVNGIDASYYWAKDLDRATAFYAKLLGVEPTMAMPGMFTEWTFADDTSFGLYKGEEFKASDGVMFNVSDVHAAIADAKSSGIAISDHVEDTPVCFMAFGSDTEGNGFILHQRK
jgi:predicted enzyme related to lactoylglutathione lyase